MDIQSDFFKKVYFVKYRMYRIRVGVHEGEGFE